MKIALCGSTRFKDQFHEWNQKLSKLGHVVYSVASFGHSGDPLSAEEKIVLDLVHLRKIIESDAIFIVGWQTDLHTLYVGESTSREIIWARMLGKRIFKLDPFTIRGFSEDDRVLAI